jgi:hypothetical protein
VVGGGGLYFVKRFPTCELVVGEDEGRRRVLRRLEGVLVFVINVSGYCRDGAILIVLLSTAISDLSLGYL